MEQNETRSIAVSVCLTELVLSAVMVGIFAALGHFSWKVVYSAGLGAGLSLLNFGVMILLLRRAEKSESVEKGQLLARGTYGLRMGALAVLLFFLLRTGAFNPLATVLPLAFVRIGILVVELFRKKEGKKLEH